MAIGEQFSGINMENLIGGPLAAAAKASTSLANSTAEFINNVGFDREGKLRSATFMFEKKSDNDDGTTNTDEMIVDVPMLAIVPIPNLQIDEVNILFDMEVKQSEKSESSTDMSASMTGKVNFGIGSVSITGSVSSHSSNTRSSDNSAKYHVDVRATNHGIPEGLARVLDMMAVSVSPTLVASTPKDANGKELSADAKAKTEKIKAIRQEISQLETKLSAAKNALDSNVAQLRTTGSSQLNTYRGAATRLLDKIKDDAKHDEISKTCDQINTIWEEFGTKLPQTIKIIASSGKNSGETKLSDLFVLKALKADDAAASIDAYGEAENYYQTIVTTQNNAVNSQITVDELEKQVLEKKALYNDAIAGKKV